MSLVFTLILTFFLKLHFDVKNVDEKVSMICETVQSQYLTMLNTIWASSFQVQPNRKNVDLFLIFEIFFEKFLFSVNFRLLLLSVFSVSVVLDSNFSDPKRKKEICYLIRTYFFTECVTDLDDQNGTFRVTFDHF